MFKNKQHTFHKAFKKSKGKFERDKSINIEQLNTNNPREFWNELNNLGPRKKTQIPMEVYDSESNITNNTNTVLNTWKSEFNELFKGYEKSEFDTNVYEYAQAEWIRLESACINMNEGNMNQIK